MSCRALNLALHPCHPSSFLPPSLPLSHVHLSPPLPHNPKELKLKYYRLMIEMCHHTEDFLQISKHYHSVYETSSVQRDEAKKKEVGT